MGANNRHAQPIARSLEVNRLPALDFTADEQLGALVADAKIQATQDGFDDRYLRGIELFWAERGVMEVDQELGAAIAEALLEERRRVLQQIVIRTCLYSVPALLVGFAIGLKPETAIAAAVPVGTAIAVFHSKD